LGAFTFTQDTNGGVDYHGSQVEIIGTLTGSGSYATGGDSFDLAVEAGLTELQDLLVEAGSGIGTPAGYQLKLGGTVKVPLVLVYEGDSTEVANATDLSTKTWEVRLRGKL
jgi:hypothetical protein